jgi:hypothetical protein
MPAADSSSAGSFTSHAHIARPLLTPEPRHRNDINNTITNPSKMDEHLPATTIPFARHIARQNSTVNDRRPPTDDEAATIALLQTIQQQHQEDDDDNDNDERRPLPVLSLPTWCPSPPPPPPSPAVAPSPPPPSQATAAPAFVVVAPSLLPSAPWALLRRLETLSRLSRRWFSFVGAGGYSIAP